MALWYLGTFPPPFGGVTTKNLNLYTALSQKTDIRKIDFSKIKNNNLAEFFRLIFVLFDRNNAFAIGVAGQKTRKRFCKLLYYINRKAMCRSLIFLMGGSVSHDIASDSNYQKYAAAYRAVYVETKGMKNELENVGLGNIHIYPNCRFRPQRCPDIKRELGGSLRCVFFSRVTSDKGIDTVLDTAKLLSSVEFHLYGEIDSAYRDTFTDEINGLPNVTYHGVFQGRDAQVYDELSKYDVMLLPTRWKHEGVPGVLVEAKIAGVPAIVSDICYNAEIVEDGVSGIVLRENTAENLTKALERLDRDRDELYRLKRGAKRSAETYYIENYIDDILKKLET